jgi:hypothetical protein
VLVDMFEDANANVRGAVLKAFGELAQYGLYFVRKW